MIESITLENWKTHKQSTLRFGKGTNVLVGVIGSGKSSVMDGLCYALFGTFPAVQNRRISMSDLLMRKPFQADQARIEVSFSVKEKKFRVERILKRNGTNEGRLYLGDTLIAGPKPGQVTERIEKELQVTYELFTRAVYSEQNNVDYFLKLNPGDRKKKFDELLELQKYETVRGNALSVLNQFRKLEEAHAQSLSQFDALLHGQDLNELRAKLALQSQKGAGFGEKKSALEKSVSLLKEKSSELEGKWKKSSELKERVQKKESQLEMLRKHVSHVESQYPAEMKWSKEDLLMEKGKSQEIVLDALKRQEWFRSKENAVQKLEERYSLQGKRKRELESALEGKSPEEVEKFLRDTQAKRAHAEGVKNSLQRSVQESFSKWNMAKEKKKMLGEEESALQLLHANCPTCKQEIQPAHKEKLVHAWKEKLTTLSADEQKAEKDYLAGQTDFVQAEALCAEFESLLRVCELQFSKSIELKALLADFSTVETGLEFARAEMVQAGKPLSSTEIDSLQSRIRTLEACIEAHVHKSEEQRLVLESELLKKEVDSLQISQEQVLDALRVHAEAQSTLASLEKEWQLEQKVEQELRVQVEHVEKVHAQQGLLKEKRARAKHVQDSLSVFSNSLIETQQQLRESVIEAINAALEELWSCVYPYKDFTLAKILIQDNDYVLTVQERNGDWIPAESSLSGGERSAAALALRMAIAFVLTRQLSWIILDEPTHNLDVKSVNMLSSMLKHRLPTLVDQVFVITHSAEIEKSATGSLYWLQREKNEDGVTIPVNKSPLLEIE